jgi:drug/metabolite transporter (DMT)-like permease
LTTIGDNRRGILALTGCLACYAVSDVETKLVGQTHPFGEVIAVRGLLTVLAVGIVLTISRQWRSVPRTLTPAVGLRSALEAISSGMYIAALIHMPMANAGALVMIHPLILVALSVLLFSEPVGWRRWSAVVVGFAGVLLIVKPTPAEFNAWGLFGLGAAFFGSLREIVTRRLDPSLPSMAVAFMSVIALTLVGGAVGLTEQWHAMGLREIGYLAIAACFFSGAVYLAVLAFRGVDISVVAPFRYTFLIWAGIAGYVSFDELPDNWAIAGAMLIVGSGLYTLHRERVRRRQMAPEPQD